MMNTNCNSARSGREVVAVAGKGGVGKTTTVAIMAKILFAGGITPLVVDADPPISLAYSLGVEPAKTIAGLRKRIIEDPNEKRRINNKHMRDVIVEEAIIDLNGMPLLVLGRAEGPGCFCGINELLKFGITSLSGRYDVTLIDCEAGIEQINRLVINQISTLLVVSDATTKGIRTAAHLNRIAQDYGVETPFRIALVINKVKHDSAELEEKAGQMGLDVVGLIPQDEHVAQYDLVGRPAIELPDNSPSVSAVSRILLNLGLLNQFQ